MNQKQKGLLVASFSCTFLLTGCSTPAANTNSTNLEREQLSVVATTTMLPGLSFIIGGDRVAVEGLTGFGIDPHLYQASAGDISLVQKVGVVVYNGLRLEGEMGEIFESLSSQQGLTVVCIEKGLDEPKLFAWEDDSSVHGPYIWFGVSLWEDAAKTVAEGLLQADPEGKADYQANLEACLREPDETDAYIRSKVAELPQAQCVLITAHDALQYFGKAYGFEVRGLQGISTGSEAGMADVSELVNFIVERKVKAVSVEFSVPRKTIEVLQAAVEAKGFDVATGDQLYSDSLGDVASGINTYILMVKANIDITVDALK